MLLGKLLAHLSGDHRAKLAIAEELDACREFCFAAKRNAPLQSTHRYYKSLGSRQQVIAFPVLRLIIA
jgi:hypothetical protein